MSTTTTLAEQIVPVNLNEKASVFIVAVDESKAEEMTDAEKEASAKAFLLNGQDFVDLQKYLIAGGELSATPEQFEAEYSRANLDKFFKADPELYDLMKMVLPRIYTHTTDFRIKTLEPMILLGGKIANFSKFAGDYLNMLSKFIGNMSQHPVNSEKYNKEKEAAAEVLKTLKSRAEKVHGECVQTTKDLGAFKILTEQDADDLGKIQKRIQKLIPDEEAKKSVIAKLVDEAKSLVKAAQDTLEEEMRKAKESGEFKWYYAIPVVGTVLFIINRIRHGKLLDDLKACNERFQLEKAKGANAIEQIVAAEHQVSSLFAELRGVSDTIGQAQKAVEKMQKTFAELATCFDSILNDLSAVESQADGEDIMTVIVNYHITEAASTWKQVYIYAKVFQEKGLARDASKEEPPIPIEK